MNEKEILGIYKNLKGEDKKKVDDFTADLQDENFRKALRLDPVATLKKNGYYNSNLEGKKIVVVDLEEEVDVNDKSTVYLRIPKEGDDILALDESEYENVAGGFVITAGMIYAVCAALTSIFGTAAAVTIVKDNNASDLAEKILELEIEKLKKQQ